MGPSIADKDSARLRRFIIPQLFSTLTQLIVLEYEFAGAQSPIRRPFAVAVRYPHDQGDRPDRPPLGIAVHDHIIVGKNGNASLKGLKLIQASVAVATSGN